MAICAAAAAIPGTLEDRLGLATRLTARWSFIWFLIAFAARPLHQMFGGIWTEALRQRRYIGLGFAAAHTIHAICFAWLILATPVTRPLVVFVGGGATYLAMWLMALTSSDWARRALGRNWKRLHFWGSWLIWAAFLNSYGGRIFNEETRLLGSVMTVLLISAALIRIPAIRRTVGAR